MNDNEFKYYLQRSTPQGFYIDLLGSNSMGVLTAHMTYQTSLCVECRIVERINEVLFTNEKELIK
jgi:hypothetical protein